MHIFLSQEIYFNLSQKILSSRASCVRPDGRHSSLLTFWGGFASSASPPLASFLARRFPVARASEWIDSLNYMFARRGNKAPLLSAKAESDNSDRTSCLLRLLFLSFPANQDSRPKDKGTLAQALLIPAHIWTKYELRPFFLRTFSYNLQIQYVSFLFQRALMVTLSVPPLSVPRVYRRDKLYLDWMLWFVCFFLFIFLHFYARPPQGYEKKQTCMFDCNSYLSFFSKPLSTSEWLQTWWWWCNHACTEEAKTTPKK